MSRVFRYSRPKTSPEESVVAFLAKKFSYFSLEQWCQHIRDGRIVVNDVFVHDPDFLLPQGATLLYTAAPELEPEVDEENIRVIYESDCILVCSKNGNLPVSEGGRYSRHTLSAFLNNDDQRKHYYSSETVLRHVIQCPPSRDGEASPSLSSVSVSDEQDVVGRKRHRSTPDQDEVDSAVNRGTPPALASSPRRSQKQQTEHTLKYRAVHRLDKETSGLVVFARSLKAAQQITTQFECYSCDTATDAADVLARLPSASRPSFKTFIKEHTEIPNPASSPYIKKRYLAIVSGLMETGRTVPVMTKLCTYAEEWKQQQTAVSPHDITMHGKLKKLKMMVAPLEASHGKVACTRVTVLGASPLLNISLVLVELLTGRTHQIRVHCAHLGFPIVGDKLYSSETPERVGGAVAAPDDVYIAASKAAGSFPVPASSTPLISARRHLLHSFSLTLSIPNTQLAVAAGTDTAPANTCLEVQQDPLPYFAPDVRFSTPEAEEHFKQLFRSP